MGDEANLTPAWMAQLPDDLKGNETFTPFKTIGDFASSHLQTVGKVQELEGKLGAAVMIPGENATDEERSAFYGRLGRPEKPDEYTLGEVPVPAGFTDEQQKKVYQERSAEDVQWFRSEAHRLGLSKAQAEGMFASFVNRNHEFYATLEANRQNAMKTAVDEMKKDPAWAGDNFQKNLVIVDQAMKEFGSPELKAWFDATGQGNNPLIVKFFHKIGLALADDTFVPGQRGGQASTGVLSYPSMDQYERERAGGK